MTAPKTPEDVESTFPGSERLGDWHPTWCVDCDPKTIHIGEERSIVLSLEEPWHGRGSGNREMWVPRALSACLVMDRRGAVEAHYEFSAGQGKCFKMTEDEVRDLIRLLSRMDEDAQEGRVAAVKESLRLAEQCGGTSE